MATASVINRGHQEHERSGGSTSSVSTSSDIDRLYEQVRSNDHPNNEEDIRKKEECVIKLAKMLSSAGRTAELAGLIHTVKPFLTAMSKAKASKLTRQLADFLLESPSKTGEEVTIFRDLIDWARADKRTFLRQSLELRLASLYYETGKYEDGLNLIGSLLKELKKIDDKQLLVEVQLLESRMYHALGNLAKSRAALVSSRTTANFIYVPTILQAALDLTSGVLHAAEEKDFKTAYSYFYEAFEGYDSIDNSKAITALKYMLLAKIMLNQSEDVVSITHTKLATRYAGVDVEAMKSVAEASSQRSVEKFKTALEQYKDQLMGDSIVRSHLDSLWDNMLEQNLTRIVEPYSRVQVHFVATKIGLPVDQVERKLSQMILDGKLTAILDQGQGILIVLDEEIVDNTYDAALQTIGTMSQVVDGLYKKAKRLM